MERFSGNQRGHGSKSDFTGVINNELESYILDKIVTQIEKNNSISKGFVPLHQYSTSPFPSVVTKADNSRMAIGACGGESTVSSPTLNIHVLFQKLVSYGLIPTTPNDNTLTSLESGTAAALPEPEPVSSQKITGPNKSNPQNPKRISFDNLESLKVRHDGLYSKLYSGNQCSNCALRFSPQDNVNYGKHLDWHFRQNRKLNRKRNTSTGRSWYSSMSGWANHELSEDSQEEVSTFFEIELSKKRKRDEEKFVEIPSVPADRHLATEYCGVCNEQFDLFFNQDSEEWQLKDAVMVLNKKYHPLCYDDYQGSGSTHNYCTSLNSSG